jgi:hypothetical protein
VRYPFLTIDPGFVVDVDMDSAQYDQALPKRPSGKDPAQEEKVGAQYSNPMKMMQPVQNPTTLVDQYGKLLVWHLPGMLSYFWQVMLPPILNTSMAQNVLEQDLASCHTNG